MGGGGTTDGEGTVATATTTTTGWVPFPSFSWPILERSFRVKLIILPGNSVRIQLEGIRNLSDRSLIMPVQWVNIDPGNQEVTLPTLMTTQRHFLLSVACYYQTDYTMLLHIHIWDVDLRNSYSFRFCVPVQDYPNLRHLLDLLCTRAWFTMDNYFNHSHGSFHPPPVRLEGNMLIVPTSMHASLTIIHEGEWSLDASFRTDATKVIVSNTAKSISYPLNIIIFIANGILVDAGGSKVYFKVPSEQFLEPILAGKGFYVLRNDRYVHHTHMPPPSTQQPMRPPRTPPSPEARRDHRPQGAEGSAAAQERLADDDDGSDELSLLDWNADADVFEPSSPTLLHTAEHNGEVPDNLKDASSVVDSDFLDSLPC